MSNLPSKPFSSGTEYEMFKYNYCEKCTKYVVREDGFPAMPEDGGCLILDNIEFARFDVARFPSGLVRELRDKNDNHVIAWHYCIGFNAPDEEKQFEYFEKMKRALFK